jgi:TRAP-type C4-dicarboxylate transport system substrate-binding protein
MNDNRQAIEKAFQSYMEEANNFWEKGNKSAGSRARGALMDLKNLAHAERTAIQEKKNNEKSK